jgi:hypothetical protein
LPLCALDVFDDLSHRRLPDVQVSVALEMMGLDFRRFVHGVLRILTFIAIAANTYTMLLRSPGSTGAERGTGSGSCRALSPDELRAQLHMPRRRKSISPLRASSGNASPRTAIRSVSYWATRVDAVVEGFSAAPGVIAMFFFH